MSYRQLGSTLHADFWRNRIVKLQSDHEIRFRTLLCHSQNEQIKRADKAMSRHMWLVQNHQNRAIIYKELVGAVVAPVV